MPLGTKLPEIVGKYESDLLPEWIRYQLDATTLRRDLMKDDELREQSRTFLHLFRKALQTNNGNADISGAGWGDVKDLLARISRSRARQGFSPADTATFVFSLKQPLFDRLRKEYANDPERLTEENWMTSSILY